MAEDPCAEVRRLNQVFIDAFNKSPPDLDTIGDLYVDDCRSLPPGFPAVTGREALKASLKAASEAGFVGITLNHMDVTKLSDDVVISSGVWTQKWKNGDEKCTKDVVIWKKIDGAWKAYLNIYNDN